jgi:hypothetical protein
MKGMEAGGRPIFTVQMYKKRRTNFSDGLRWYYFTGEGSQAQSTAGPLDTLSR